LGEKRVGARVISRYGERETKFCSLPARLHGQAQAGQNSGIRV